MHDRRFRFGISASKSRSRKEFTELARKAEDLGYRTPATDKLTELNKDFQQSIIKYLSGATKEGDLDTARNKYVNSDAFKQHEKEMNDWYKNK